MKLTCFITFFGHFSYVYSVLNKQLIDDTQMTIVDVWHTIDEPNPIKKIHQITTTRSNWILYFLLQYAT